MARFSAQGHMVVRRRPENGDPGEKGAKPWFSTYAAGRAYRAGVNGEEFYDIVFVGTLNGTAYNQFFRCLVSYSASVTHNPSYGASTTWWEYLSGFDTMVADMLLANNAFIQNLSVQHLNSADGTFTGGIKISFINIESSNHAYMYSEQDSDNPSITNYHYMFNPDAEPYIRMNSGQYKRVVIHIPNSALMDGKRIVFWDPFIPASTGTRRCRLIANNLVSLDWRGDMINHLGYPDYIESMWGGICEILCVWDSGDEALHCNVSDTHYSAVFL